SLLFIFVVSSFRLLVEVLRFLITPSISAFASLAVAASIFFTVLLISSLFLFKLAVNWSIFFSDWASAPFSATSIFLNAVVLAAALAAMICRLFFVLGSSMLFTFAIRTSNAWMALFKLFTAGVTL